MDFFTDTNSLLTTTTETKQLPLLQDAMATYHGDHKRFNPSVLMRSTVSLSRDPDFENNTCKSGEEYMAMLYAYSRTVLIKIGELHF